jgi:hypothetical protein
MFIRSKKLRGTSGIRISVLEQLTVWACDRVQLKDKCVCWHIHWLQRHLDALIIRTNYLQAKGEELHDAKPFKPIMQLLAFFKH